MADKVIDQHSMTAHSQSLANEPSELVGSQMVGEKARTHQIEAVIGKRQREGIRGYTARSIAVPQVTDGAIEQRDIEP